MTTAFPAAIDTFISPISGDYTNSVSVPHHTQHTNANDAITAIETAILGIRNDLAASTIVPGATSWSVRNNANSSDNFIITDAGSATLRGTLSLALAASRIVPGATSFSIRDHANANDVLKIDSASVLTYAMALPAGTPTVYGDIHGFTTTFNTLTGAYGTASDQTRAFCITVETDTSVFGYAGILNAFIARVHVNTGTGSSIGKVEGVSGVVNIKAGSLGDLAAGGYATDGEYLHNSSQTITGTQRAVQGSIQILSSGSFTTAYGGEFVCNTTAAQTGTFANLAQGVRGYIEHNHTTAIASAVGASGEVFQIAAGTITGATQGVLGWIHNTAAATFSSTVYGVQGLVALTGAAVTSNVVYGVFGNTTFAGTTVGGTTNAALYGETRWTSTANASQPVYAAVLRWRVENASITAMTAGALHILAPVVTSSPTGGSAALSNVYGDRIENQGSTASVTSSAIRIENQSGSTTNNFSLNVLGGTLSIINNGATGTIDSQSQAFTLKTSTSGTLTVQSAGLLTLTGVGASAWTPGAGATIVSDTTTGIKIGTVGGASGQKLGFFNQTPIVQPLLATGAGATADNIITALQNLGLVRQS